MSANCLVIDLDRCIGCHACEVACKTENDIALGEYWNRVVQVGPWGTFPDLQQYWIPAQCQQCTDAPCITVCPTGASYRNTEDGIVLVNDEICIGCRYCMMACPYGVRTMNKATNTVQKCTLCGQLTSVGEEPACVSSCCANARFYGDLDDPDSDVSKYVASVDPSSLHKLTDVGNHPLTYYILSDSIAEWQELSNIKETSDAIGARWEVKEG